MICSTRSATGMAPCRAPSLALPAFAALALSPIVASGQSTPQDAKNTAAYLALSLTPQGALPPLMTRSMAGGPAAVGASTVQGLKPQFAVRYGRGTFGFDAAGDNIHVNTYAATGMIAAGEAATLTGTVGLLDPDCSD